MRLPATSVNFQLLPVGAAKRNVERPKSKANISSALADELINKSRPVIPASNSPDPTYIDISFGRK
ncbi:unannotated protein [freshwater metagenome]|uniref:Unannotated protein n=1 Tax=freshwater metagenome TaxID=449393 RepID=A0A6J6G164_9ZZZZ